MKEQLALLRELQNIDLDLDKLKTDKVAIQDRLSENRSDLEHLIADLNNKQTELEELRKMQTQKANDLQEIKDTLKERKKRLLNVGSTKEYNAVEKEIEILQKSQDQITEEIDHLKEVIEKNQESIESKALMTQELQESLSQEEADVAGKLEDLDAQVHALTTRTDTARSEVNKRILYKYDFIRSRRPGLAIVAAKDGHCTGCFMALPPQLFIQVQRGDTLETCPSCQRIMFFQNEEEQDDAA